WQLIFKTFALLAIGSTLFSLLVAFYIYDLSDLYRLNWLDPFSGQAHLLNIHAGFDELSPLLRQKFPKTRLTIFDFYDPLKHTEVSIKRARRAYPPDPNNIAVATTQLPLANDSVDRIFLVLAAHEIRDSQERDHFFQEIYRILHPTGQIVFVEHLRDGANFLAFNWGFLHFHSKKTWTRAIAQAHLLIRSEQKITPFIHVFTLTKDGNTS
ncbi:MAG: methyltransferase domain-containing protein, partial [Bacteroidota bacterium]